MTQLSVGSSGEVAEGEHDRVSGDGIGQDSDRDHAAACVRASSSKAVRFHCSFLGSYCCVGPASEFIFLNNLIDDVVVVVFPWIDDAVVVVVVLLLMV